MRPSAVTYDTNVTPTWAAYVRIGRDLMLPGSGSSLARGRPYRVVTDGKSAARSLSELSFSRGERYQRQVPRPARFAS